MHDCSLTPACYFDKTWNLLLHFLKEIKSNRLNRTEAMVFQKSIPWLQFFSNFVDDFTCPLQKIFKNSAIFSYSFLLRSADQETCVDLKQKTKLGTDLSSLHIIVHCSGSAFPLSVKQKSFCNR